MLSTKTIMNSCTSNTTLFFIRYYISSNKQAKTTAVDSFHTIFHRLKVRIYGSTLFCVELETGNELTTQLCSLSFETVGLTLPYRPDQSVRERLGPKIFPG